MAKAILSKPIFFFFLIQLCLSGRYLKRVNGQESWCVANPMATNDVLMQNLDYACSHVECGAIQQGGACFYPNTYMHHASFAMNLYYQTMGRHQHDCDFKNSGLLSSSNPSYGSCSFESGGYLAGNGTSGTWCVAKPGTSDNMLQANINFACNHVDCSPTHDDGPCFNPTTLINHASFAMNLYYQHTGRNDSSCDFKRTGLIVTTDPSYGGCYYQLGN